MPKKREHHEITLGLLFIPLFQQQKGNRRKRERGEKKKPKKREMLTFVSFSNAPLLPAPEF